MNAYSHWTLQPLFDLVGRKILKRPRLPLEAAASKQWEVAPGDSGYSQPAYYLPGQLERVTGWEFSDEHPRRAMEGGVFWHHTPTRAFLLKEAMLVDGALHASSFSLRYRRPSALPIARIEAEIETGAFYCTEAGIKWFGNWLMADCLTYPLASALGQPITVGRDLSQHMRAYEALQQMEPTRLESAFIKEAIIFDDVGQNGAKRERSARRRDMLLAGQTVKSHPGAFILRGMSGMRRVLVNELELAQYLNEKRGFRIVDPMKLSVDEIMAACAGADTVMGVEGSGLMHGIAVLAPGGKIVPLQPPERFVSVYKDVADRDGLFFGFVVGTSCAEGFRVNPIEVERTLDLFPPALARND
jgi:hypothetical protein